MYRLWVLMLVCALTNTFSAMDAATPHPVRRSSYHRTVKRPVKREVQKTFSFIPPKQPIPALEKLRQPLTGRVVEVQTLPEPSQATSDLTPTHPDSLPSIYPPVSPAATFQPQPSKRRMSTHHYRHLPRLSIGMPRLSLPTPKHLEHSGFTKKTAVNYSWVEPLPLASATQLAENIAELIDHQAREQKRPLAMAQMTREQLGNPLSISLEYALQRRGYSIATPNSLIPDTLPIRYRVTSIPTGILVRIRVADTYLTQVYSKTYTGALVASSPISKLKLGER